MEIITISRNKRTGDRSYSHGIWQVCGRNNSHIAVYPLIDDFWAGGMTERRKHFLSMDEHDFADALPLLNKDERSHCLAMCLV